MYALLKQTNMADLCCIHYHHVKPQQLKGFLSLR